MAMSPWKQIARSIVAENRAIAALHARQGEIGFIPPRISTPEGQPLPLEVLLAPSSRAIVLGPAGSGKTTLLKYLAASLAEQYLNGSNSAVPILVRAPLISDQDDLCVSLAKELSQHAQQVDPGEVRETLASGRATVLFDALDELRADSRPHVTDAIRQLAAMYPKASVIVSSRPIGSDFYFPYFRLCFLSEFDLNQIREFTGQLSQSEPRIGEQFIRALLDDSRLANISRNPLLLTLLWQTFRINGRLPTSRSFLYADVVDYILTRWNQKQHDRSLVLDIEQVYELFESVALYLYTSHQHNLSWQELKDIGIQSLSMHGISADQIESALRSIAKSGLVREDSEQRFSFIHLSFKEYFVARALRQNPKQVALLLPYTEAREIILLACGLMDDVTDVVQAAIDRGDVLLAAKCLSNGRAKNTALVSYVVQEFAKEIGGPFVRTLVDYVVGQSEKRSTSNVYAELLAEMDASLCSSLTAQAKGKKFEEFAIHFFSQVFKIVDHDLNTEDGEIDLIAEIIRQDPFWAEFGGDVLIECKNWASHVPLKEVAAFTHKVSQKRVKLAFFISVSGFTADAIRTLKNQSSNTAAPLVVPMEISDIKDMLLRQELFEEFTKQQIRKIKYLRKW